MKKTSQSVLIIFLITLAACSVLSYFVKPEPNVQDEFAYLLAADTFAHGRLSNKSPPVKAAFESAHILVTPTYSSKFPPGQGLILALGQILTGAPIAGVWLSCALMSGAVCWMLQSCMPLRWAITGALISTLQLVFWGRPYEFCDPVGYWSQSYFGGALTAFGGALVFGALFRLGRSLNTSCALVLCLGIAVLSITRPCEGGLVVLPAVICLLIELIKRKTTLQDIFAKLLLPIGLTAALGIAALCNYNRAITGEPLLLPYILYQKQYAQIPIFFCQSMLPLPHYDSALLQELFTWLTNEQYLKQRNLLLQGDLPGLLACEWQEKLLPLIRFFLGYWLILPFVLSLFMLRTNRLLRLSLLFIGLETMVLLAETGFGLHYAAPVTGLIYLVVVQGLRLLDKYKLTFRGSSLPIGHHVFLALMSGFIACTVISVPAEPRFFARAWYRERAAVLKFLETQEGKHLVLVRYSKNHSLHHEWVYNGADIPAARVIWAHDLGEKQNKELLHHFPGRKIWLLQPDKPGDAIPALLWQPSETSVRTHGSEQN